MVVVSTTLGYNLHCGLLLEGRQEQQHYNTLENSTKSSLLFFRRRKKAHKLCAGLAMRREPKRQKLTGMDANFGTNEQPCRLALA